MHLVSYSHSYGQSCYYIVLVTKYRKEVLKTKCMRSVLEVVFQDTAKEYDFEIHAVKVLVNHVHLFVSLKPTQTISWMIRLLKGISARRMFQLFPEIKKDLYGGHFWSRGKFFRSVGSVTAEAVEHYIEHSQAKHLVNDATPFKVW